MSMTQDIDGCTYIDDLTITDKKLLATLCLLYEKVSLPHPYEHDPSCEAVMLLGYENERYLEIERKNYLAWKSENHELFKVGALEVLPSPISVADMPKDLERALILQLGPDRRRLGSDDVLYGRVALAMHALYARPSYPDFALFDGSAPSTGAIVAGLRGAIFRRYVPMMTELRPEQILELREWTAKYRQGFRVYLATLADDVENDMASSRRTLDDAARTAIERKMERGLLEYLQQELPARISWWAEVVQSISSSGTDALDVADEPWSLKNYFKLTKNMAGFVKRVADHVARSRSSDQQAYQFIAELRKRKRVFMAKGG